MRPNIHHPSHPSRSVADLESEREALAFIAQVLAEEDAIKAQEEAAIRNELEHREIAHRIAVRYFWLHQVSIMALVSVLTTFSLMKVCYATVLLYGPWTVADWRIIAAMLSIVLLIPPIVMGHPEAPTEHDVRLDRAIKQQRDLIKQQRDLAQAEMPRV